MGRSTTLYVGLDVHKDSVDIATCTGAREAKPEHLGTTSCCSVWNVRAPPP